MPAVDRAEARPAVERAKPAPSVSVTGAPARPVQLPSHDSEDLRDDGMVEDVED